MREHPARARVFERYRIDYCCGGHRSLLEVCVAQHVDLPEICGALGQLETTPDEPAAEAWAHGRLTSLIDHIVATHHEFLRRELPRLTGLLPRVCQVHGEKHPDLAELQTVFRDLSDELTTHLEKEERILFPWIRRLAADQSVTATLTASVNEPIRGMEHEHRTVAVALATIRRLTNDFVPPADACPTYWTLLDGFADLEQDLHLHIHKENNILCSARGGIGNGRTGTECIIDSFPKSFLQSRHFPTVRECGQGVTIRAVAIYR